ncbi:unnamed protein product [Dibothriocephalus latus]|uniref:Uncharacterized protein n=1 Tax=Dibothriocephalus latus TaxID=60516 RepID=A0A3P6SZM2_DIBLA|nr:unnamed protein product [Dibothriocephalus latus]
MTTPMELRNKSVTIYVPVSVPEEPTNMTGVDNSPGEKKKKGEDEEHPQILSMNVNFKSTIMAETKPKVTLFITLNRFGLNHDYI